MATVELKRAGTGSTRIVAVVGEMDLPDRGAILRAAKAAIHDHAAAVVVDLSGVTFIGAVGMNDLVQTRRLCLVNDVQLLLRAPAPCVRHLLAITELADDFAIAE